MIFVRISLTRFVYYVMGYLKGVLMLHYIY